MSRATEIAADNPRGHWTNDETSGSTMVDVSGNSRNGTFIASPTLGVASVPPGVPGTAVQFNGSTRCDIAYGSWMPTGQFSFEMWLRPTEVSDNRCVAARHGPAGCTFDLLVTNSGRLSFRIGTGPGSFASPVQSLAPMAVGGNYHIVGTYDGAAIRLYVNAVLQDAKAASPLVPTPVALTVAALSEGYDGGSWYLRGVVDDIVYYDTALSQARISAHYNPPIAPNRPTDLADGGTSETSITVTWAPPASGVAPASYEVRINGGAPIDVGLVLSHTFSGLLPGTAYNIEVRSVFGGLRSSWLGPLVLPTTSPPVVVGLSPCYAMVRGSAVRATELDSRGHFKDPVRYATSRAVASVTVNEVVESGSDETIRNPERQRRLRLRRSAQVIRYTVDVKFLRVDPGLYSLVSGVTLVYNAAGDVVGFDVTARERVTSFGLEVWSKLASGQCADGTPMYGYTLFPYLSGGRISGFSFTNGLVSFTLIGARSNRRGRWGVGPYNLEGPFRRLVTKVSGNTPFRTLMSPAAPPVQMDGIQVLAPDVVDNGTADNPMPDPTAPLILDGGGAVTEPWIVDGGRA